MELRATEGRYIVEFDAILHHPPLLFGEWIDRPGTGRQQETDKAESAQLNEFTPGKGWGLMS
jgi:hypothetical protein